MNNKQLRERINKIRDAQTSITEQINAIYSEFSELEENITKSFMRLENASVNNNDDFDDTTFIRSIFKEEREKIGIRK